MIMIVVALMAMAALLWALEGQAPRKLDLARTGLIACLIAYGCFTHWQLYNTDRMKSFPVRADRIILGTAIAILAVRGISVSANAAPTYLEFISPIIWLGLASALLIIYRLAARELIAKLAHAGFFDERVAVYGIGQIAERVEAYVREAGNGMRFVGAFDDRTDNERREDGDVELSGSLGDLIETGRGGGVDRIIVALPQAADRRLAEITRELDQLPVTVHAVTHFSSDLVSGRGSHKVSNLGPVGLINVKERPLADWSPIIKRAEDVIISASLLLLLLPVIAIIALSIKLTSRGPVLFRQRRHGLNQRVIEVLKFR